MTKHIQTKKPVLTDWHPADIKAAIEKAGWSLRGLSAHHGYAHSMLAQGLHKPYPNAERIIADVIGVPPETIWPSRYQQPRPRFGTGGKRHHKNWSLRLEDCSTSDHDDNVSGSGEIKQ